MTGFINVDKAEGVSSAHEVAVIKRLTGVPCGHMGTLDPMATGVLPIAIGKATRLFDYLLDKRKIYRAKFRFGVDSDTLDTTGQMRLNAGYVPTYEEISAVLHEFVGEVEQLPPKYSAKNVNGRRGYELAREGVEFSLTPKKVKIYSIKLINQTEDGDFEFEVECGGGTYIRAIARDMAARLNTFAVMSGLGRIQSGIFKIDNAVRTSELTAQNIEKFIIPPQDILPFKSITAEISNEKKLLNGLAVKCGMPDGIYKFFLCDGTFYGLADVNQSVLKVRKKLC